MFSKSAGDKTLVFPLKNSGSVPVLLDQISLTALVSAARRFMVPMKLKLEAVNYACELSR